MTAEMLTELKQSPELPEGLRAAIDGARPHGNASLVELSGDQAIELAELCQWYIKSDPATGELTARAEVFDSIVTAIDDAQFD